MDGEARARLGKLVADTRPEVRGCQTVQRRDLAALLAAYDAAVAIEPFVDLAYDAASAPERVLLDRFHAAMAGGEGVSGGR